jgi:hypothetical protein
LEVIKLDTYQYFVNVSDLTTIKGVDLMVFQLTLANRINGSVIIKAEPNKIDGNVVLLESEHYDEVKSEEQLTAICSIFSNKFKLRCYRRKSTSRARPKIYKGVN